MGSNGNLWTGGGRNQYAVCGRPDFTQPEHHRSEQHQRFSTRGCIAGIQIVNTYEGVKISATLDGTSSSEWTSSQLGDAAWTDSADGAGTYASINVTNGPGALTIADGETRHTDAILLTGGNLTIPAAP